MPEVQAQGETWLSGVPVGVPPAPFTADATVAKRATLDAAHDVGGVLHPDRTPPA